MTRGPVWQEPVEGDPADHLNALLARLRGNRAFREEQAAKWYARAEEGRAGKAFRALAAQHEADGKALAQQIAALVRLMQLTGTLNPAPRGNGPARLLTQSFKIAAEESGFNAAFYLQVDRLPADLAPVAVQFKSPGKFGETGVDRLLQLQNAALRLALSPQVAAEHLDQEAQRPGGPTGTGQDQEVQRPGGPTGKEV